MADDDQYQTHPGRIEPCCIGMSWAVSCGYIRKGFLWKKYDPPRWFPWSFYLTGKGWADLSPIDFCPFCNMPLNEVD